MTEAMERYGDDVDAHAYGWGGICQNRRSRHSPWLVKRADSICPYSYWSKEILHMRGIQLGLSGVTGFLP